MSLREVSERCSMARGGTETESNLWVQAWSGENQDTIDSPDSVVNPLKDLSLPWLPQAGSEDEPLSAGECVLKVEENFLKFDKALELACKCEDEEAGKICDGKRGAFEGGRSYLRNLLDDLDILRDQFGLDPPDADDIRRDVEAAFNDERPVNTIDRYQW